MGAAARICTLMAASLMTWAERASSNTLITPAPLIPLWQLQAFDFWGQSWQQRQQQQQQQDRLPQQQQQTEMQHVQLNIVAAMKLCMQLHSMQWHLYA